jgi:hypothetical protein
MALPERVRHQYICNEKINIDNFVERRTGILQKR